jgi:tetratricopeptide (TPR) repeat protein
MTAIDSEKFGEEVLLVFIGHSSDADVCAEAIYDLERELQRVLDQHLSVVGTLRFKTIRMWEWQKDALPLVGGQSEMVAVALRRANIAVFVFKERIGSVSWDELTESQDRVSPSIPVMAFFPSDPPSGLDDIERIERWRDLVLKRRTLVEGWSNPDSKALRPMEKYRDPEHLRSLAFEQLRNALVSLLKLEPSSSRISADLLPAKFLGNHEHLSYDRQPVFNHTLAELDQEQLNELLEKPLAQDLNADLKAEGEATSLSISEQLENLGCLYAGQPTLGALLCFAPGRLLADKSGCCTLQMAIHDASERGGEAATSLARGNLLLLYEKGMSWLKRGAELRRTGRIGTKARDDLEIPEVVLREALANALVHRDYQSEVLRDQPTRIDVYPDKVEITSYGLLLKDVPLNLLNSPTQSLRPFRRNPVIAGIFQCMTLAELNASGIHRMRRRMTEAGLAFPMFRSGDSSVCITLARPFSLSTATDAVQTIVSIPGKLTALISSTTIDLPEHRKAVRDACLRAGIFPIVMENHPAKDVDAIRISLEMVERADIYFAIYAWRYGYVPDGHDMSIAEMELNRAIERKIPILVFLIHQEHPLTVQMVEADKDAQEKLQKLKEKASLGRRIVEFSSPEDLRGQVIHSLSALLKDQASDEPRAPRLHPPNVIPTAPQAYIAHPYSLLQTSQVVGRQAELNLLTDWVTTNKHVPESVRLVNLVAIGGMGKSALTWKWFNDIAPHELPNRAGWMWWSFYESDAHYENFIIRALAYTSGQSEQDVRQLTPPERENQLWHLLDEEPFVLVLDGLERILLAYSRMDASQMLDDDLDERTANFVARSVGLPESAGQSFVGKHQLRRTADQRAGQFLRRLASVRASRLLISTRLYPAELQVDTGEPLPGCFAYFLRGLTDDDALNLWREFSVSGSREELLPLFRSFGNYPLLVRALAGEVAGYRPAPGNFDQWHVANPDFNPAVLPLKNAKTHVLEFALRGLDGTQRQVLNTLAAFRMPATWETLQVLLVGEDQPCIDDLALDLVLTSLEDRGLMGWDRQANRYDLHPIVRGVVWAALAPEAEKALYRELYTYFDGVPRPPHWDEVESLEDLTPAVELFDKLIGLERYEDAFLIFRNHLDKATLFRLSASQLRVEMLERLFPNGLDHLPRLGSQREQTYTLNSLAFSYQFSGEPGRAAPFFRRAAEIEELAGDEVNAAVTLSHLAAAVWPSGKLRKAEESICRALQIGRGRGRQFLEGASLRTIGRLTVVRGETDGSQLALNRALGISVVEGDRQNEGLTTSYLAERFLLLGHPKDAYRLAQRAWELAQAARVERHLILAARLKGQAALGLADLEKAEEHLHHALTRARAVNLVEEELPTLTAMTELHRQRKEYDLARELLQQVWSPAERGPYPLFNADARNLLARIEQDEGHRDAAIAAATRAYELAWCDGPPYAYHYGLTNAKQLLAELGAPEPKLPPFDESRFEPVPEVEINPKDEFWVNPATLDSTADD